MFENAIDTDLNRKHSELMCTLPVVPGSNLKINIWAGVQLKECLRLRSAPPAKRETRVLEIALQQIHSLLQLSVPSVLKIAATQ
jgi:hypothetical protein